MLQVHRAFVVSIAFGLVAVLAGPPALEAGNSNWYLQGKLGDVDVNTRFGTNSPKTIAGDDSAAGVEVGYSASPYLALQAGYHNLGEHTGAGSPCPDSAEICIAVVAPLRAELSGLSLSAVPRFPFNDRWSAFGRVGIIDWKSDVALAGDGFGNRRIETFDDRDLLTALGVQYDFPTGLGLLIERQRFDLTGGWTTLGASWRF